MNNASDNGELLDEAAVAKMLGVKQRTIRLWRDRRELPCVVLTPRVIRFRRADIDKWVADHLVTKAPK